MPLQNPIPAKKKGMTDFPPSRGSLADPCGPMRRTTVTAQAPTRGTLAIARRDLSDCLPQPSESVLGLHTCWRGIMPYRGSTAVMSNPGHDPRHIFAMSTRDNNDVMEYVVSQDHAREPARKTDGE